MNTKNEDIFESLSDEEIKDIVEYSVSSAKIKMRDNYPIDYCIISSMKIEVCYDRELEEGSPFQTAFTNCINRLGLGARFIVNHLHRYSRVDTTKPISIQNIDKDNNFTLPILIHEVRHKALKFMSRLGQRNPQLFNVAQDYYINTSLVLDGIFPTDLEYCDISTFIKTQEEMLSLPEDKLNEKREQILSNPIVVPLADTLLDLKEETSESIYDDLYKKLKDLYEQSGKPAPSFGEYIDKYVGEALSGNDIDVSDYQNLDETDKEDLDNQVKNLIEQGESLCKQRGLEPGNFYKKVKDVGVVKPSFKIRLISTLKRSYRISRNYNRANKRKLVTNGQVWPHKSKIKQGELAILVDTSGSCSTYFGYFFSCINGMLKYFNFNKVHVIQVDTIMQKHDVYKKGEILEEPNVYGVGGTDFRPGFIYMEENDIKPDRIIYLTDGYAPYDFDYPQDTIWAVVDDGPEPEYGEVVRISRDEVESWAQ